MKKRSGKLGEWKGQYWLIYTVVFAVGIFLLTFGLTSHGKGVMRYDTGLNQYFYSFYYWISHLKKIISTLWKEKTFSFPMWDMSIGYGSDILTTLHYYAAGDPLNLLALWVKEEHLELAFTIMTLLRLYLAGISFSFFCFLHGKKKGSTLIGTMVYIFCGWTVFTGLRWTAFSNPMIYLPLLCIGIDRIYQKKGSALFIIMTAVSGMSCFYFFYMLCLAMFGYGVVGYFCYGHTCRGKEILKWLGKFLFRFLIGTAVSAVILLPVLLVLFGGARIGTRHEVGLLYSFSYYLSIPVSLVNYSTLYGAEGWGFLPIVLPVFFLLVCRWKRHKWLAGSMAALFIILCFPAFSYVLNGFSYIALRWSFIAVFIIAYVTATILPEFETVTTKERWACIGILVLYAPLWYIIYDGLTIGYLLLVMATLFLLFIRNENRKAYSIIIGINFMCIAFMAYPVYSVEDGVTSYNNYVPAGTVYHNMQAQNLEMLCEIGEGEKGRFEQLHSNRAYNINLPMLKEIYSTQFWFSLAEGNIARYFEDLYISASCDFDYDGLDGRSILELLAAVKYYMIPEGEDAALPWQFQNSTKKGQDGYEVWETDICLPFGYTYEKYIPLKKWQEQNVVERQYSMLQACVLEESSMEELEEPEFSYCFYPYTLENTEITEKGFRVQEDGQRVKIRIGPEGESLAGEYYIIFHNLEYDGSSTTITTQVNGVERENGLLGKSHNQYSGRKNFIYNLGYWEECPKEVWMECEKNGNYTYDSMEIAVQPVADIGRYVEGLKQDILEQLEIGTNQICGNIVLEAPKILCLSVPYSRGWTAFVDGQKAEIKQANGMFMALELPEGFHMIEFRYCTPGIRLGSILTLLGIGAAIGVIVFEKKWRKADSL